MSEKLEIGVRDQNFFAARNKNENTDDNEKTCSRFRDSVSH